MTSAPDIRDLALEAVDCVQNRGVKTLLDNRAYFDAQVRVVCPLLHDNPTLVDIRDYLIKTIRLEHARIKLGHYTASFDRLRAALQLSSAVHWMLAREAKSAGSTLMDDTTERALEWLMAAGAILPAAEYATELAKTARGAEEMRPGIIEQVAAIARSGESYDGSDRHAALLGAVTTMAFIDAACRRPPVRLVYTRAYTPVPPEEEERA